MKKFKVESDMQILIDKIKENDYQYTPEKLRHDMVTPLIGETNKKVLVIRNLEFIETLRRAGFPAENIYYSAPSEIMKEIAINMEIPENQVFKLEYNNMVISFGTDMEFDIIVANPPYKAGLHLRFLNKAIDLKSETGEIVFIHPAEWLVQKRMTSRTRIFPQLKSRITGANIKFITNPWGGDAKLFVPLSITHIISNNQFTFADDRPNSKSEKISINSLDEIFTFGKGEVLTSMFNKVLLKLDLGWSPYEKVEIGNHYIGLSNLLGDGYTDHQYLDRVNRKIRNMYSLVNSSDLVITNYPRKSSPRGGKEVGNDKSWFSFETLGEAQSALDFLSKTKFVRAWLSIIKINQHAADSLLPMVPWLDWTQEWTDEKINEYFGFTQDEVAEINRIVDIITVK